MVTSDTEFDPTKTYYELINGSYVATTDTVMDSEKTYYEDLGPADPRLPLPAEIKTLFAAG